MQYLNIIFFAVATFGLTACNMTAPADTNADASTTATTTLSAFETRVVAAYNAGQYEKANMMLSNSRSANAKVSRWLATEPTALKQSLAGLNDPNNPTAAEKAALAKTLVKAFYCRGVDADVCVALKD